MKLSRLKEAWGISRAADAMVAMIPGVYAGLQNESVEKKESNRQQSNFDAVANALMSDGGGC